MAGDAQGIEDQWLSHNGATLQDWQEAGDFGDDFETFAAYKVKGKWDAERNRLYKKLLHVDISQIRGAGGPARPVVPEVDPWVRLLIMEDVKLDNFYKFTFE